MKRNDVYFMVVLALNVVIWIIGIIYMLMADNAYLNVFIIIGLFIYDILSFGILLEKTGTDIPVLNKFIDKLCDDNNF